MPLLQRSMPVLEVADVVRSAAFYHQRLGFDQGSFYGDPPAFCIVGRDKVTIALQRSEDIGTNPPGDYLGAYVYVDDVDALRDDLAARGAVIERGPEDMPHGCREIEVRDLDGHIICFGQDLFPTEAGPGL